MSVWLRPDSDLVCRQVNTRVSTVNIFDIQRFSVHDGPGIRTTVFLKGCPLRCAWCQNPESVSPAPQLMLYPELCLSCGACTAVCPEADGTARAYRPVHCTTCGRCVAVCPTGARALSGRDWTVSEVVEAALRDRAFYGSDGGVTFGGGEPLRQWDAVREMALQLHGRGIHVAVDTAGLAPRHVVEAVPKAVDLVLCDLKLVSPSLHRQWTGVDNAQILASLHVWSREMPGRLWVTTPVIPGVHDAKEITRIAEFISDLDPTPSTRLIPYHRLGESKYAALGKPAPQFREDDTDLMEEARDIYTHYGLHVLN